MNTIINGDLFQEEFCVLQYKYTIEQSIRIEYSPFHWVQKEMKKPCAGECQSSTLLRTGDLTSNWIGEFKWS
jgi:hypothetical protein